MSKVTTRIIAEVDPDVKKQLREIAKATDNNMTQILVNLIAIEHDRVVNNIDIKK